MTDRQKTRERPNPRRAFAQSYGSLLNEGFNRRTLLKGFLATSAVAALGGGFRSRSSEPETTLQLFREKVSRPVCPGSPTHLGESWTNR